MERDPSQILAADEARLPLEEPSARIGGYMENSFLRHHQVSLLYLVNHHLHSNLEITGIEMMTLIIDNEGDLARLRLVIGRRQEVFREEKQVLLRLEDVVVVEAAVVAAGEVTNTVLADGKHRTGLYDFHLGVGLLHTALMHVASWVGYHEFIVLYIVDITFWSSP